MSAADPITDSVPAAGPGPDEGALDAQLKRVWGTPKTLWGWLATTDHKMVGRRYIVTGFVFFVLAGLLAAIMRAQLSGPERHLVTPDQYNQIFTVHGATMMFLFGEIGRAHV